MRNKQLNGALVERKSAAPLRRISGWASTTDADRENDVILAGAWDRSVARANTRARRKKFPVLWQHKSASWIQERACDDVSA